MPAPPNPYSINIELFWPDGTRPNQNQIARVRAFDVNGSVVTDQGQSGFNPTTGGWQPVVMQSIAAFYPPREKPNLRFQVEATTEQVAHTTQVFNNIPSGSTVKIVIGQSDELAGSSSLTFVGSAKLVVHAKTATSEQRFLIEAAQNPGTLLGNVGAIYNVVANGLAPWTLRLQQKVGTNFVDRNLVGSAPTTQGDLRTTFVMPADSSNITLRIEQTVSQPGSGTTFGTVSGSLTGIDGQPLAGVTVSLFAKKARGGDTRLGDPATTGSDGRYGVVYPRTQPSYDLYVQATQGQTTLVTSRIVMGAGLEEVINLVAGGTFVGPSEFDRHRDSLTPALAAEGLQLADLRQSTDSELALFSAKSAVLPTEMVLLKQSVTLANQTGIAQEVFFALGRQQIPLTLPAILATDREVRAAAIDRAIAENQIPESKRAIALTALETLKQQSLTAALAAPAVAGDTTLGGILTTSGLSSAKQTTLVNTFSAHTGTAQEFWTGIRQSGALTTTEVAGAQFALQLGAVTQNHLPLVKAIRAAGITQLKNLTQFDENGWLGLVRSQVDGRTVGVAPDLAATGMTDTAYAKMLFGIVEEAFPTAMLARRTSALPRSTTLAQFYTQNPSYEMRATTVTAFLRTNPTAVNFIADPTERAAFVTQLKGMERIQRLAPSGSAMTSITTLVSAGVDSAFQIYTMGQTSFRANYASLLGAATVDRIFARATNASVTAALVFSRYGATFDRAPTTVTWRRANAVQALPDYQTLFGSLDFCSCQHCQSAFSPAAYLVDVLHWLDARQRTANKTPLTVLFQRRADIGTVELSCANTNTPLPYLDLVNEVLELQVAPSQTPVAYQTRGEAGDLAAHPEHLRTEAYDVVAGAVAGRDGVYPFNLPFNLWLTESRTYLEHLGIARSGLMEAFFSTGLAGALTDPAVSREALALSPLESDLIAGKTLTPARTLQAFWGLASNANVVTTLQSLSTFLSKAAPPLSRDGMDYSEFTDLWRTSFVQSAGAVGIWFTGVTCDTGNAVLPGLVQAHLERVHRFVRLRRRLGWSAADLDRAIQVLGAGQLTEALIIKLASVERLRSALHLELSELLTWWGPLDTRRWAKRLVTGIPAGAPGGAGLGFVFNGLLTATAQEAEDQSFYDRLFLSRSVEAEPSAAFYVRPDGAALITESALLSTQAPAVAAALGISADDLLKLTALLPNQLLTLANLSALYRHVSLARALGLDVGSLISLLALTRIAPFDATHPENALLLIDEANAIGASGLSVPELDYLLRHVDTKPASLEPQDEPVGVLLLELRDLLRKVAADNPDPPLEADVDQLRERLARELAKVLPAEQVGPVLALVDLDAGANPPAGAETLIDATLSLFLNAETAKNALARPANAGYLSQPVLRLRFVLQPLIAFRRAQATRAAVIDKLAANLGLDAAVAAPVLEDFVFYPGPTGASMVALFSNAALVAYDDTDPDSDAPRVPGSLDFPNQFAAYKRLHKIALVLSRFGIQRDEIAWVFGAGPARGTLNVQTLPIAPPAAADVQYGPWARLRDAVRLRDRVTGGAVFDLFEAAIAVQNGTAAAKAAAFEALLTALVARTRWNRDDIEFLAGAPARGATPAQASALGLAYPQDFQDERWLTRIDRAMTAVRRIGLAARTLFPWRDIPAATASQITQAREVKQAVRARLGEAQWRETTRELRDALREKQRDALAGWLIGNGGFADVFALFDQLLIDVEMSACQLTSRIKQAISSVQMFVQRAQLNGETEVRLQEGDIREWRWMKNYRVWEANRKVFLYPENYIEPELRDDKSPFFEELEDELLQGDLDDDAAERAVLGYLEKLDDVARLEIAGHYRHVENETNVLHVFGRTRSAPYRYFHRQWVDGSRWTPWEKVELDIESDQVVPFVHNRRLYLFWLFITEKAVEEASDIPVNGGGTTKKAEKYFQLRLVWSEFRNGKWSGKKLSSGQVGATDAEYRRQPLALVNTDPSQRRAFFLQMLRQGADLQIRPIRVFTPPPVTISIQIPQGPVLPPRTEVRTIQPDPLNVRMDNFRLSGCDGTVTLETDPSPSTAIVRRPSGTKVVSGRFVRDTFGSTTLTIPRRTAVVNSYEERKTLTVTTPFQIVPVEPVGDWSDLPFFYEDLKRSFFVIPKPAQRATLRPSDWAVDPDSLGVDLTGNLGRVFVDSGVERPVITRQDPRIYDISSRVTDSIAISVNTDRLVTGNVAARGGPLVDRLVTQSLQLMGPSVKSFGNDAVSFKSSALAIDAEAVIRGSDGSTFRFQSPGSLAAGRTSLTGGLVSIIDQPPSTWGTLPGIFPGTGLRAQFDLPFRFYSFYHPFVCPMIQQLNRFGLGGLLDPAPDGSAPDLVRQKRVDVFFQSTYTPTAVQPPYPNDEFDFSYGGAYASYNWELFFHVPFMVAVSLTKNRRFEEALRWFHYVFDPTESDAEQAPQRFWKIRPFFELFNGENVEAGPIQELLLLLQYNGNDAGKLEAKQNLLEQLAALAKNPFNPHALARLRPVAYQKAVVLKYIDNLIQWGDELFRRDTIESINEATLLYVLAARLLGRRPRQVAVEPPTPRTFNELRGKLDASSNALVEIESYLTGVPDRPMGADNDPPVLGRTLFFCIPPNDKLLTDGWNRVEDRLFKIRHCLNIEGVARQLALFEPPIDPALLVRAAAAGIDLGSVLSDVGGSLPLQRYAVLAQRALDLTNDVRGLGQALLAALEKKDTEALSLLRSDHEIRLLGAVTDVRQRQIEEAQQQLESVRRSREVAEIRQRYYRSRQFLNTAEKTQIGLMTAAGLLDVAGGVVNLFAAATSAIPDIEMGAAGFGGTPVFNAKVGGTTVSNVSSKIAEGLKVGASALDRGGSLAGLLGSHERRADEWQFLAEQAQKEIEQLERQIVAAEIRVAIAEKELDNHRLQIEQSREVAEFLQHKFTNEELYSWMVGQLSSLYFQSYQLAYDVARRAERAWQFELAQPNKTFIQFGYWDGLKKGLLAGDRLHFDIQRMATAYLEENRREYELTRHVSLRQLDPMALISLRRDGQCFVRIPEAWFDLDSPGHYLRRLKTVSVTVPSVTGPYVSVRLTLTLVSSSARVTPDAAAPYRRTSSEDSRFRDNVVGIQSIVTSSARDDGGLFETNLRDERYLPFEGAGAISEWRLELPAAFRQFDYETISDVVLHLRYTAREGGRLLRQQAETELTQTLQGALLPSLQARPAGQSEGLLQLVSAASDLPDLWHRFLHPPETQPNQSLSLELAPEVFPFPFAKPGLGIASLDLFLLVASTTGYTPIRLRVTPPSGAASSVDLTSIPAQFGGLPHAIANYGTSSSKPPGTWTLLFDEADNPTATAAGVVITVNGHRRLNPAAIRDLFVAVRFRV